MVQRERFVQHGFGYVGYGEWLDDEGDDHGGWFLGRRLHEDVVGVDLADGELVGDGRDGERLQQRLHEFVVCGERFVLDQR